MAGLAKDLPPVPLGTPQLDDDGQKRPGFIKRVTTKLRTPSQSWVHTQPGAPPLDGAAEEPPAKHKRKISLRMPTLPGPSATSRHNMENSWTSPEQREAALRASGLIPSHPRPRRDAHGYKLPLSEQEERLDREWAIIPEDVPHDADTESEAQRIKEAWMKKNADPNASSLPQPSPSPPPPASSPPPPPVAAPQREPSRSPERARPEFHRDPNVARLMQAMQGYKPENYRPPPKRAPTMPNSNQRYEPDSDSDSDEE